MEIKQVEQYEHDTILELVRMCRELGKYKQALQRIKDKTTKYNGCKSLGDYILQIISEVEE